MAICTKEGGFGVTAELSRACIGVHAALMQFGDSEYARLPENVMALSDWKDKIHRLQGSKAALERMMKKVDLHDKVWGDGVNDLQSTADHCVRDVGSLHCQTCMEESVRFATIMKELVIGNPTGQPWDEKLTEKSKYPDVLHAIRNTIHQTDGQELERNMTQLQAACYYCGYAWVC